MKTLTMDEIQLDALKEVGNIGAGNAITSLATLLDRRVDMSIPRVGIVDLNAFVQLAGGEESCSAGVYMRVEGDAPGHIAFLMPYHAACRLVDSLLGYPDGTISELDELGASAILEVGNILASSYQSALCEMIGLDMHSSPPALAVDMTTSILSAIASTFEEMQESILTIVTHIDCLLGSLEGYFIYIPDEGSLTQILQILGLEATF